MLLAHLTSPEWATVLISFVAGLGVGLAAGIAIMRRDHKKL